MLDGTEIGHESKFRVFSYISYENTIARNEVAKKEEIRRSIQTDKLNLNDILLKDVVNIKSQINQAKIKALGQLMCSIAEIRNRNYLKSYKDVEEDIEKCLRINDKKKLLDAAQKEAIRLDILRYHTESWTRFKPQLIDF